ncbi:MAG: AAA family ATPase, partial [Planctomycetota bacterium]|nr:AAA family ATPase [Planctomycetota bacterium]
MRLKQMLFVGFKSFAERTSIDFRSQLTAIVGPNGCGKSNIVDAFRWALGEQSVKSLRGSSMGDVIFNGTDSRPPAGYAEVVLHLDAPELAPKMGGERHLSIRRKLFRDGTSEYFINGRPCRLKEIRHLLADTGIGATYYSVIGQQNVSAIVEMDSVKRRELLEEAAG